MNIEICLNEFTQLWNNAPNDFISVTNEISIEEKLKREEGLIRFSKAIQNEVDLKKMDVLDRQRFVEQFKESFGLFFKNSFSFSNTETAIISDSGFVNITKEFMLMARRFDPEVNMNDVFQASRNLWIINSLQIMMDAPVKLTPSIFAYSMLYPYSDNYLDDPSISSSEKKAFSDRFRQRLNGEHVLPANNMEQTIFDLVALIEEDWDRNQFPEVYESLLAIHDAQTKSIGLINANSVMPDEDLLSICIEKGGTSVLADGYLINGTLTPEQQMFCFGFGAFLQFVDDIQDIKDDMNDRLNTFFIASAKKKQLDHLVNKTFWFGQQVMSDLSCFSSRNLAQMSSLMIKSNNFLLTEAVGLNNEYYPKAFIDKLECFSPFRFEFIRKRRSNLESNRISLMKKIGSFVFDEAEMAMQA